MELMLDTANLKDIEYYNNFLPIVGVTTNPSILKSEGKVDIFQHLNKIKNIIGDEKSLHVQVTTDKSEDMIKEAYKIREKLGKDTYIKVPITEEGLKAIMKLKKENFKITGTAIYTSLQGDLAIMANVDYIAPYYNRMENINVSPADVINHYSQLIDKHNKKTKILAASFRNVSQITTAYENGAHCTTVNPQVISDGLKMPSIDKAVKAFSVDWKSIHGNNISLYDYE